MRLTLPRISKRALLLGLPMSGPSPAGGSPDSVGDMARVGVVTVSDRASSGEYADLSGPEVLAFLEEALDSEWQAEVRVIPDERTLVEQTLIELVDDIGCCLVVTTGGTGPAPRDITPDATAAVCDRILPGFGEQMRAISLRHVPTAILSRQVGGTRGGCLLLNLPGAPQAIRETIDEVFPAVPYCIDLVGGPYIETTDGPWSAFRPKHARR